MRKRILITIGLVAAVLAAGCAGGSTAPASSEAQSAEAVDAEEPGVADTAAGDDAAAAVSETESETVEPEFVKYESDNGWFVEYDAEQVAVTEEDDNIIFTYTGEGAEGNSITISYYTGEMPDEALYNAMADDNGPPEHERTEGYFAGRSDVWALQTRVLNEDGSDAGRQYTAVEHNGGSLIVEVTSALPEDEEAALRISDTMAAVLDSFTFTEHEPQQMYAYIPGTYVQEVYDEVEGSTDKATYSVQLNEDHTGVISLQDDVPIIWYCRDGVILSEETGEQIYEYAIEGDMLYLTDPGTGDVFEFEKSVDQTTAEE